MNSDVFVVRTRSGIYMNVVRAHPGPHRSQARAEGFETAPACPADSGKAFMWADRTGAVARLAESRSDGPSQMP
jgi:hypothetical protein